MSNEFREDIIGQCRAIHGDCLRVLPSLEPSSVDTVITDPPYGLAFMGKEWDHGVPGVPFWEAALRVAKPGAFLLAFGGTRTFHRLACAIEDAGWELRDTIMWVYGSGFPKSLDISKAIDRQLGDPREVSGIGEAVDRTALDYGGATGKAKNGLKSEWIHTEANTDAARQWDGWGTALKPAWEPIIVAMKPLDGTFANNAITHGVAGLHIDGGRIQYQSDADQASARPQGRATAKVGALAGGIENDADRTEFQANNTKGRFPANLIHDGSDEVTALFPNSSVTGRRSADSKAREVRGTQWLSNNHQSVEHTDSGSAARFFFSAIPRLSELCFSDARRMTQWIVETASTAEGHLSQPRQLADSVLRRAVTEASQGARRLNDMPDLSTIETHQELRNLAETLISMILITARSASQGPPQEESFPNGCRAVNAEIQKASGTTGITISHWKLNGSAGSVTFDITQPNLAHGERVYPQRLIYCPKASRSERGEGNIHPTVKPLALMEYLCKLTRTPTGGTVLDLFAGSFTTAVACVNTGRECVAIEREDTEEQPFFTIGCNRVSAAVAAMEPTLFDDDPEPELSAAPAFTQSSLFGE